ncbi:MAG: cupin domain-containing protein [Pseudomonadota bacterium]
MQIINTGNAEHYRWGEVADGWHLVNTPDLSVIEERVPPGVQEVRHAHATAQQFFYVLAGEAELEVDGTVLRVHAGSGCQVPAGAPHQFRNTGDVVVRFLVVSQPHSHGDRVTV